MSDQRREYRPEQEPGVQYKLPPPDHAIQPDAPDFTETPDVEPLSNANEAIPFWVYLICGVALFFVGSSFTGFDIFGHDLLDQGPGGPAPVSSAAIVAAPETPADIGKKLYGQNCANCHQGSGIGQPGSYPPLAGSEYVLGNKDRLSLIMLAGVSGPLTVKGESYGTQVMPGWASNFTDDKLADIMTYLRTAWGNTANAVKGDEVAAARTKFASKLGGPASEASLKAVAPDGPDPSDKK
jgi:mono/diheme cytochrome c family protein